MKKILLFLTVLFCIQGYSQVSIKIKPSHPNFMQYDAVRLRILLHNYSSMPIAFGQNQEIRGDLDFVVYYNNRTLVSKSTNSKQILSGIILKPGEVRTVTIDLAKYFSLQKTGDYTVTAILQHPKLSSKYQSNQISFRVGTGSSYWHRTFGVPDYTGKNYGKNVLPRKYDVRVFNNGKTQIYFLIVEDDEKVYAVKRLGFNLGPEYPPQLVVDGAARFHAMLHINQKVFIYYIYNYNGKLEKRQVYIKTTTTPFLVVNPTNSTVIVDGGRIALKDIDYEEIKDLPFMDSIYSTEQKGDSEDSWEDFGDFDSEK